MKNLHFISVYSSSPQDACETADVYVSGYGTEENYYRIGGCISESDEVYLHDIGASHLPDEERYCNLKMALAYLAQSLTPELDKLGMIEEIVSKEPDWFFLSKQARLHDEIKDVFDLEDINLFEDEFFGGMYEEVGLSQCPYDREYNHPDFKNYLVFVSMHS